MQRQQTAELVCSFSKWLTDCLMTSCCAHLKPHRPTVAENARRFLLWSPGELRACPACRWLLTNFDCSCMWVQDAEPLKAALSLMPAFLRAKGNAYDFKACRCSVPVTSSPAFRLAMSH